MISPFEWGTLWTNSNSSTVYNQESASPDFFWKTGYYSLQKFIATYLATEYKPDFQVDAYVQRYPRSPIYANKPDISFSYVRDQTWKWIGATMLSICMFTPLLSYLNTIVKEHQIALKDLLEISGTWNISYWTSYFIVIKLNGQLSM